MKKSEIEEAKKVQTGIKNDRLALLKSKDYIGTKIAMGVATKKEYADDIALTVQWREEFNAAEAEIERLDALEPDDEENEEE